MKTKLVKRFFKKRYDAPLKKILVLGVGNLILSDEGVGVYLAKRLKDMELPPGIYVVEGESDGFGLLEVIMNADRLIIVDSVKGGGSPGSVYRFDLNDVPNCIDFFKISFHQIGILEIINLSRLIGKSPETIVIGVEPKNIKIGTELSSEVESQVPKIIELVIEELNRQ